MLCAICSSSRGPSLGVPEWYLQGQKGTARLSYTPLAGPESFTESKYWPPWLTTRGIGTYWTRSRALAPADRTLTGA